MTRALASIIAMAIVLAAPATGARTMTDHVASGAFDVTMTPVGPADATPARMTIAKTFHGALEATSAGEMMSMGDPRAGSAGYVAMERVSGTLDGRKGAFALQHSGTMHGGAQHLSITVVPGSGAEELAGIAGDMSIEITGGVHHYTLRYSLPD